MEFQPRLSLRRKICGLLTALACIAPLQAFATLGGDDASIESDRLAMNAAAGATTYGAGYSVKNFTLPSGTVVREYLASSGTVFGVGWDGPIPPDVRQLLGPRKFAAMDEGARARNREGRRGPGELRPSGASNLVIDQTGHMRAFAGRAYLTDQLPTGVDANAIR